MPHTRRPMRIGAAVLVAAASCATIATGGVALAGAAQAALIDVPPTGHPGRLVLSSEPFPESVAELSPGQIAHWAVSARLEDAERATLALELRKWGALADHPRGLIVQIDSCDVAWTGLGSTPTCATGAERVTVATPDHAYDGSSPTFDLEPLETDAPEHLLVALWMEETAEAMADESLMGQSVEVGIGLSAASIDGVPQGSGTADGEAGGGLPVTGLDARGLWGVLAFAAGLSGLGLVLRIFRKEPQS